VANVEAARCDPASSASRLDALVESAALLHASRDPDEPLRHLLRSAMGRLVVSRALVALVCGDGLRVAMQRGVKRLPVGAPFTEAAGRAEGLQIFVPMGDPSAPLGVLALGPPARGAIDPEEARFLRALAGLAASGVANARAHAEVRRLNARLDLKVHELETLLELVQVLARLEEPEEVAQVIGLTLAGTWAAARYVVAAERRGHPPVIRQRQAALAWPPPWRGELDTLGEAALVGSLPPGPMRSALDESGLAVLFPFRPATRAEGFVALGPRAGGRRYDAADLAFGQGVVAQGGVALERAWHLREVVEKKQMERELALAAGIQRSLFPAELPALGACDVAAVSRPARQVGGDYYDAMAIDTGTGARAFCCVADVSGKGLAASLVMSSVQATLRALLGREASLAELARCTNDLLHAATPGNKYVTGIFLGLCPATGAASYVNAGHAGGLVVRAGGLVEPLPATGLPLGLFPGATYDERGVRLSAGDLVALYSDGVTEARSSAGDEFGGERLASALRSARRRPAREIVAAVMDALDAFVAGTPQHDDITLLVVSVGGLA
jgi:sigma-B regulation protein RsbU (phosphoserine phosphatase)